MVELQAGPREVDTWTVGELDQAIEFVKAAQAERKRARQRDA